MKILICPDAASARTVAAHVLKRQIVKKPASVLGLATGRTMEAIYKLLVTEHRESNLDFSSVTTFNLDEYIGLDATNEQSYHYYMQENLFSKVNVSPNSTHVPNGAASDVEAEAKNYEAAIAQAGGIDLQLLGLGQNGHIGFNEPLSSLNCRTRAITLAQTTLEQNAEMFGGNPDSVPSRAITMGTATILESHMALMVVTGPSKAQIAAQMIEGPVTAAVPGSALQYHPSCLVILDEDAASALVAREAIDWQMRHDPELVALTDCL
ncbi:MAG: glucosamine-6-phosphate deaminase [Gluconobacter cerinus]|uniref:glucosamine-6-phosphate deaminase n=1 Tax=Gluconobacter cerinus TaxID=38307 RepID=UPI0039EB167D